MGLEKNSEKYWWHSNQQRNSTDDTIREQALSYSPKALRQSNTINKDHIKQAGVGANNVWYTKPIISYATPSVGG